MKILALDLGDVWTGTAISDPSGILARPYQTVPTTDLLSFLTKTFAQEKLALVIIGHPQTLRGTESLQTKKTVSYKEELEQKFPTMQFILWDERLTSKQASKIKSAKTKEEKIAAHSLAAALILQGYLEKLQFDRLSEHL